jgi:hypothetical protein
MSDSVYDLLSDLEECDVPALKAIRAIVEAVAARRLEKHAALSNTSTEFLVSSLQRHVIDLLCSKLSENLQWLPV